MQRGVVRTRTPIDLDKTSTKVNRDFTLRRGVLISGKLVDEKGDAWQIGTSFGQAYAGKDPGRDKGGKDKQDFSGFSLTNFRNRHRPADVQEGSGGSFAMGEGDYRDGEMIFPTESTFIIQGMMPGHTTLDFTPSKEKLWGWSSAAETHQFPTANGGSSLRSTTPYMRRPLLR